MMALLPGMHRVRPVTVKAAEPEPSGCSANPVSANGILPANKTQTPAATPNRKGRIFLIATPQNGKRPHGQKQVYQTGCEFAIRFAGSPSMLWKKTHAKTQ